MSLEQIIEKIEQETETKKDQIIGEAKAKAAEILQKAKEQAEEFYQDQIAAAKKRAEVDLGRGKAMTMLELRKEALAEKQKLIDEVFTQAANKLLVLSEKEYLEFIRKKLLETIETGQEEIGVSAKDQTRINQKFIQEINAELKRKGKKGAMSLAKSPRPIQGGFILSADQVEINCSLEAILKRRREEVEQEVAIKLFGKNPGH